MNYGRPVTYPIAYTPAAPRNLPYPYQAQMRPQEWYTYQPQTSYQQPVYPSFGANVQPSQVHQYSQMASGHYPPNDAQFLFQNPLQPQDEPVSNPYLNQMNGYPTMNPYPKQSGMIKQPGGIQSLMNSFKSQDGTVDINKMVNTAGQMVNAVSQVSSLVKGLGGIFKTSV